MGKRELTFFIPSLIICIITGIFIASVCQYIGVPYIITILILFIVGFSMGFTGRVLYEKYEQQQYNSTF